MSVAWRPRSTAADIDRLHELHHSEDCYCQYLLTKGSSIIVIIFTSVHSVRWGEGVKGIRTLF